jgi:hypothetical protein
MTLKYEIKQDEDPESPREWGNLGIMVCFHKRYNLGDETDIKSSMFDGRDELKQHLEEEEGALHILPLYLMDHSGLAMSTSPFSCPWDSGQVGFIYATKETIEMTGVSPENVEAGLIAEVKIYDQFLTGDVWGYTIVDDDGEILDSCCGFYGRDDCEAEAKAALAACEAERAAETRRVFTISAIVDIDGLDESAVTDKLVAALAHSTAAEAICEAGIDLHSLCLVGGARHYRED